MQRTQIRRGERLLGGVYTRAAAPPPPIAAFVPPSLPWQPPIIPWHDPSLLLSIFFLPLLPPPAPAPPPASVGDGVVTHQ